MPDLQFILHRETVFTILVFMLNLILQVNDSIPVGEL